MSKKNYKFQRRKTLNSIPKIFINVTQLFFFHLQKNRLILGQIENERTKVILL